MSTVLEVTIPLTPAPVVLPQLDLPLNSRAASCYREETQIELLVQEMIHFDPDYAEQLALDGLNRLRH